MKSALRLYCGVLFAMCFVGFAIDIPADITAHSWWWTAYDIALCTACAGYFVERQLQ